MIKIYAKNKGNQVDLKIKVTGNGADVAHEAIGILTKLPEQLGQADPLLLKVVTEGVEKHFAKTSGADPDETEEAADV